jgi:addiction module HigA family antidote
MRNPPHPGLVLREYLGDLAVTKAVAHLRITRVTLSRVLNGKAGVSAAMAIRLAAARHDTGAVDEHAVEVRSVAGTARKTTGGAQICACDSLREMLGQTNTLSEVNRCLCRSRP